APVGKRKATATTFSGPLSTRMETSSFPDAGDGQRGPTVARQLLDWRISNTNALAIRRPKAIPSTGRPNVSRTGRLRVFAPTSRTLGPAARRLIRPARFLLRARTCVGRTANPANPAPVQPLLTGEERIMRRPSRPVWVALSVLLLIACLVP